MEMTDELHEVYHDWVIQPFEDKKWIPLEDMKLGYYLCKARNFYIGYWNGLEFDYMRQKFNFTFPDTEEHWDRGSPHGTARPIKYLGDSEQ